LRRSEIRELLKVTRLPETISFAGGLPDPAIFPYQAIKEAAIKALDERGPLALQYSPTEGEPYLREQLAAFMQSQGEKVTAGEVFEVASSQQALDLIGKVLIDPHDPIVVELPSYIGALQAFTTYNPEYHGVPMDEHGVIPEELERTVGTLCRAGRKPKFVYLIPDFQNPSGVTLSVERRKKVLEIASKYDLLMIEDSPYRELRFTGELLPSLYSMDTEKRVLYIKTFSKMLCPGFRIGWYMGPAELTEKLVMAKQGTDLCTSAFSSFVVANFIAAGHLENQIVLGRKRYETKAKLMMQALEKDMPGVDCISWSKPEGGVFLWVRLPEYMDTEQLLLEAAQNKVIYVAGKPFYCNGSGRNTMRLNFSYPTEEQIVEGIRRLARVVAGHLQAEPSTARSAV
jgi:2-aminoadipate transaminase